MRTATDDIYIEAAAVILESPLLDHKTAPYVHGDRWDWERLLDDIGAWSSGEQLLVRLAAELFNSALPDVPVRVADLVSTLDDQNFAVAMRAINHLRGTPRSRR